MRKKNEIAKCTVLLNILHCSQTLILTSCSKVDYSECFVFIQYPCPCLQLLLWSLPISRRWKTELGYWRLSQHKSLGVNFVRHWAGTTDTQQISRGWHLKRTGDKYIRKKGWKKEKGTKTMCDWHQQRNRRCVSVKLKFGRSPKVSTLPLAARGRNLWPQILSDSSSTTPATHAWASELIYTVPGSSVSVRHWPSFVLWRLTFQPLAARAKKEKE